MCVCVCVCSHLLLSYSRMLLLMILHHSLQYVINLLLVHVLPHLFFSLCTYHVKEWLLYLSVSLGLGLLLLLLLLLPR